MLTLHIEAESVTDLKNKLVAAGIIVFSEAPVPPQAAPEAPPSVETATGEGAPTPEPTAADVPKKRGRPKKDNSVAADAPAAAGTAEAATPPNPPVASAVAPSASVSMDDVRKAAQQVVERIGAEKGMNEARRVLVEKAGVKVLRDIPADKLDAVYAGLQELLTAEL